MKKVVLLMGLTLLSDIQNTYAMNSQTGMTAEEIELKYMRQMQEMAKQFQEEMRRTREAYEQAIAATEAWKQEVEKTKSELEKENVLRGILLQLNVSDKTPIRIRANDILDLDILMRHAKTNEIYQRFLPYRELYGRSDLGVEATPEDLDAVKNYIDETITVMPKFPDIIEVQNPGCSEWQGGGYHHSVGRAFDSQIQQIRTTLNGLPVAWKTRFAAWISSVNDRLDKVVKATGRVGNEEIVMISPYKGGMKYYNGRNGGGHMCWWDADGHYNSAKGAQTLESTQRSSTIKEILGEPELQQICRGVTEVVFPSESFNHLVNQVNRFIAEGLRDTL